MVLKKIGILDPEGKKRNPLTGEKYSENYIESAKNIWTTLPLYKNGNAEKVIQTIKDNRVLVLEAGTGAGKTVFVPKYCLHAIDYKGKVIVTVPKKAIASENATRDAKWLDVVLGEQVGYQYRGSKLGDEDAEIKGDTNPYNENTVLRFSTDGTLVSMLTKDPRLLEYNVVVIDEAHERSTGIDEALLYMRNALRLNPKLKLVVMSATLEDPSVFLDYYQEFSPAHLKFPPVPNKPVELVYLDKNLTKKDEVNAERLRILFEDIIQKNLPGDVLIFVNAGPDALPLKTVINNREPSVFVTVLTAGSKEKEKELAVNPNTYKEEKKGRPVEGWSRRVVIATNVAESSVTIEGLKFVIDSGTEYKSGYNSKKQQSILVNQMITRAQADQRKGRVGRREPGTCYRLYTETTYNKMVPAPEITIVTVDMTYSFLKYMSSPNIKNLFDLVRFIGNLIEPPPNENIINSIRNLITLSLVSQFLENGVLTEEGDAVADISIKGKLPDINSGKSILSGKFYGCEKIVIILVAILKETEGKFGIKKIFTGNKKDPGYEESIMYYRHSYGDLFSFYKVFMDYSKHSNSMSRTDLEKWAKNNFIDIRTMDSVKEESKKIYMAVRNRLEKISVLEEYRFKNLEEAALFSLIKGYFPNIAKKITQKNSVKYSNFYPDIVTTASFDRSDSYFSRIPKAKLPKYMFYISNSMLDKNTSFKICNICPVEMIKLLQPEEKVTLHGLKL